MPALLSVRMDWRQVIPLFRPSGPGAAVLQAMQAVLDDSRCATENFLNVDLCDTDGPWSRVQAAIRSSGDSGQGNPVSGLKALAVTRSSIGSGRISYRSLTLRCTSSTWVPHRLSVRTMRRPGGSGHYFRLTCAQTEPGSLALLPQFRLPMEGACPSCGPLTY